MCEVIYVNGRLDKVTDVQIASPNTVTRDELYRQLSNVTSSLQTMQNQLSVLTETFNTCTADCQTGKEWQLAFRGTAGIGKSVYSAYKDGVGLPANVESGCKQVGQNLSCSNHYRNSTILDNWKEISEVAFVVYKNDVKVRQVIFDGAGSTYMNWLDKSRVKESSWTDIKTVTTNFFSIDGDQVLNRTFFMNHLYRFCPNDFGWFVAVDRIDPPCPWEKTGPYPVLKYSTSQTNMNYNDPNVTQADYFGVLVRFFNLP